MKRIVNFTLKRSCWVFSKSIRAGFFTRIVKVAAFSATEGEISKLELSPSNDNENIPLWPLEKILKKREIKKDLHRPGIEPGPPAWQASILPLNHRCLYLIIFFTEVTVYLIVISNLRVLPISKVQSRSYRRIFHQMGYITIAIQ